MSSVQFVHVKDLVAWDSATKGKMYVVRVLTYVASGHSIIQLRLTDAAALHHMKATRGESMTSSSHVMVTGELRRNLGIWYRFQCSEQTPHSVKEWVERMFMWDLPLTDAPRWDWVPSEFKQMVMPNVGFFVMICFYHWESRSYNIGDSVSSFRVRVIRAKDKKKFFLRSWAAMSRLNDSIMSQ